MYNARLMIDDSENLKYSIDNSENLLMLSFFSFVTCYIKIDFFFYLQQ